MDGFSGVQKGAQLPGKKWCPCLRHKPGTTTEPERDVLSHLPHDLTASGLVIFLILACREAELGFAPQPHDALTIPLSSTLVNRQARRGHVRQRTSSQGAE